MTTTIVVQPESSFLGATKSHPLPHAVHASRARVRFTVQGTTYTDWLTTFGRRLMVFVENPQNALRTKFVVARSQRDGYKLDCTNALLISNVIRLFRCAFVFMLKRPIVWVVGGGAFAITMEAITRKRGKSFYTSLLPSVEYDMDIFIRIVPHGRFCRPWLQREDFCCTCVYIYLRNM